MKGNTIFGGASRRPCPSPLRLPRGPRNDTNAAHQRLRRSKFSGVVFHEGRVAFDVANDDRSGLDVPDLLKLFSKVRGEQLDDDALLLA